MDFIGSQAQFMELLSKAIIKSANTLIDNTIGAIETKNETNYNMVVGLLDLYKLMMIATEPDIMNAPNIVIFKEACVFGNVWCEYSVSIQLFLLFYS